MRFRFLNYIAQSSNNLCAIVLLDDDLLDGTSVVVTLRGDWLLGQHERRGCSRYNLGMVLESLGDVEAASDCMATALEVETTNPILPILSIPVTFE